VYRNVSCTGSHPGMGMARHWAAGDGDLQVKCQLKTASTFRRLVIRRSVFLFLELGLGLGN